MMAKEQVKLGYASSLKAESENEKVIKGQANETNGSLYMLNRYDPSIQPRTLPHLKQPQAHAATAGIVPLK